MTNRTALVTGGARGIGLGITHSLVREGFTVAACGTRTEKEAAPSLADLGKNAIYIQADISKNDDRERLLDTARTRLGRLDLLVNNAGITSPDRGKDLLDASEESFDRVFSVNLKGPYFLTQAVAKWMIEQKKSDDKYTGKIVNISSISTFVVSVNRGDYCLSKAGMAMMTKVWATRLAEHGIPVYEICPGLIRSDMSAPAKDKYDKLIAEGLLLEGRWGEPEDVGRAVAMLSRGDLPYATGQVLNLDGGLGIQRL